MSGDPPKIVISGATGFVGSALVNALTSKGSAVWVLTRTPSKPNQSKWDPANGLIDTELLEGADAIINLAGENVAALRWTSAKKKRILESRVQATSLLAASISSLRKPPQLFLSASATGYYGNRVGESLDEDSPPGQGFLADVTREWERAALIANGPIRTVILRIGVVLGKQGGALKQMLLPFSLGLGGVLGTGRQIVSWISLPDLVAAIEFVIASEISTGAINAVSPNPVTNRELTKTLGKVLRRPTFFSVPSFLIRLGLGELGAEMLLSSANVKPSKLSAYGFKFQFPELEAALMHAL